MAITYEEIKGYLDSEGIKYLWVEEGAYLATGFNTSIYRRDDGTPNLAMAIKLEEDGEYFKLVAPKVYVFKDGPTKLAFWQTLLMICWKTKLLEFEYDDNDGEVRCIVEFPIEDGTLTKRQLMRCLRGMVSLIEEYHPVISKARAEGVIQFNDGTPDPAASALQAMIEQLLAAQKAKETAKPSAIRLEE
jgi:hypothetical protein